MPLKKSRISIQLFKIVAGVFLLTLLVTALQIASLNFYNPGTTAWMRMRVHQAAEKDKKLTIKHTFVPLRKISLNMQKAVISAEDDKFYDHFGFDIDAIQKAFDRNNRKGKIKRGGSTITQQLAKNLYLYPKRSYWRKGREAVITIFLEILLSKKRILELYLNYIEWGNGIFGVQEAANYYFKTTASRLNLEQSCRLASIIPSPRRYKIFGDYVSRRTAVLVNILQ